MKIKKLFKDIPVKEIKGSKEIEITGICINSKVIVPGNLFIAKKGIHNNGAQYITEAVDAGAVAVLTDMADPSLKHITQIIHPNPSDIEGAISAQYYHFPSKELFMVGITGTNGKTTTSFLVKHLLDHLNGICGLIGTIEYIIGEHRYQATHTTPDVSSNQKMLREMILQGCRSAVMEVSSHALDQGRINNIEYDIAIFTNLTLDHLDYHKTMDHYGSAKSKLFSSLDPIPKGNHAKMAIVNADDPAYRKMISECKVPVLTYGINSQADIKASNIQLNSLGTKFDVTYQGKTISIKTKLVGRFNVYNALAAMGVALSRHVNLMEAAEILSTAPAVSARIEPVPNDLNLNIYVDFAHSDDALLNVLQTLHEFKKGRLITVFGCGGDRDKSKRPKMAEVAEKLSDLCIVTSDNPRSEDPAVIAQEIILGFKKKSSYEVLLDRYAAIERAISLAQPEDVLLIAGKGHETYQIFAHHTIEFDDRKVAAQICQGKRNE